MQRIDIRAEASSLDEFWCQEIVGEANGNLFKVAKGIGSTSWHKHDDEDEVFFVYKGRLPVRLKIRVSCVCTRNTSCRWKASHPTSKALGLTQFATLFAMLCGCGRIESSSASAVVAKCSIWCRR